MTESNTSYEQLIERALENAIEDRAKASESFDAVRSIFDIDPSDPSSLQGIMLLGQTVPKLLELATKSNEQIIKLAQIREKEKGKTVSSDKKSGPISFNEIKDYMDKKASSE